MKLVNADKLLEELPDDLPYKGSVKRVLIQAEDALDPVKAMVDRVWQETEGLEYWQHSAVQKFVGAIFAGLEGKEYNFDEDS